MCHSIKKKGIKARNTKHSTPRAHTLPWRYPRSCPWRLCPGIFHAGKEKGPTVAVTPHTTHTPPSRFLFLVGWTSLDGVRGLGEQVLQLSEDLDHESVNNKVRVKCSYHLDDRGRIPTHLEDVCAWLALLLQRETIREPNKKPMLRTHPCSPLRYVGSSWCVQGIRSEHKVVHWVLTLSSGSKRSFYPGCWQDTILMSWNQSNISLQRHFHGDFMVWLDVMQLVQACGRAVQGGLTPREEAWEEVVEGKHDISSFRACTK